jgi:hypothetical protein
MSAAGLIEAFQDCLPAGPFAAGRNIMPKQPFGFFDGFNSLVRLSGILRWLEGFRHPQADSDLELAKS